MGRYVTTKDFPRINLRLPPDLYEYLNRKAAEGYRSLNSEVTLRLEKSMKEEKLVYEPSIG